MKRLQLFSGGYTLVDDADFDRLSRWSWRLNRQGYAVRTGHSYEEHVRKSFQVYLHREVLGDRPGLVIDHINRNKLDNRRSNLRHCSQARNIINGSMRKDNSSGVRGVRFKADKGKWIAEIGVGGRTIFLGGYMSRDEAIIARQEAESRYYLCA